MTLDIVREVQRRKRKEWIEITVFGLPGLFARHISPEPTSGCWLWTAADTNGYGKMRHPELGTTYWTHRYAYEFLVGPIPEDLQIDHICNVRCCVNPDHMELVTKKENLDRRRDRMRQKTVCRHGHSLTGQNLYINPKGTLICRACRNEAARRFLNRRKNNQILTTVP